MGRLAGAHRLSGLRGGLRGYQKQALGDGIDWGSIIQNSISTAGQVAAIAVKPPTYSSTISPTGLQTITSYGATVPSSSLGLGLSTDLTSLLTSPIVLLGGLALLAVVAMKR